MAKITRAGHRLNLDYGEVGDADTHKTVTSDLREAGYEEDRAASYVNKCAGSFKNQHDTGKNLKTIVVFPKISGEVEGSGREGESEGGE